MDRRDKTVLRFRLAAVAAGLVAAAIGGYHLIAWFSGVMATRGLYQITMKTNAALCLFLAAIALIMMAGEVGGRKGPWLARGCAIVVMAIGFLTLLEHLFTFDFGIDEMFAQEAPGAVGFLHPNRMGPPGAITYTLAGLSLLLLLRQRKGSAGAAQALALIMNFLAVMGMLGYLYGVQGLYGAARFTVIALPATVGNFLFSIGLLCFRPTEGLMARVTSADPGGMVIRRFLPAALIIPVILGWLRLQGEWHHLYEHNFGTTVLILSWIAIFSCLIYRMGTLIDHWSEKTRESEARFRGIFENAAVGISLFDPQARLKRANSRQCETLGYTEEELLGKSFDSFTHPQDHEPDLSRYRMLMEGSIRSYSLEKRYLRKDGGLIWVRVTRSAQPGPRNLPEYSINIAEDISARKEAEEDRERLLAEVQRSNQELQQFAYLASHDLQEPLRTIAGYLGLLERKYSGQLDEKARTYIGYAADGAGRMQKLIEGLLNFSRISRQVEFASVDTNAAFKAAVTNLEQRIEESGGTVNNDPLPIVPGDENQLVQLFQNLIGNGLKYRKPDILPHVHVSAKQEGNEWLFSVSDNGIGIESRHYDRIFQIFQRLHTSEEYPGTGIGLASCRKIVERHGGRIWVESVPGRGSVFYFTLPAERNL
ncbi:ATP-binding protein [Geotalea sp. SG265]|uniref:sensor histidine kinase n=1 Tax=Geotalea sp. SG265 TaxID=2922867 RepID=UPI001FAFB1B3|nr:ATP-binding protein [Geotalea sp. SG265]